MAGLLNAHGFHPSPVSCSAINRAFMTLPLRSVCSTCLYALCIKGLKFSHCWPMIFVSINPTRKRFFIKLYVVISPSDAGFFFACSWYSEEIVTAYACH